MTYFPDLADAVSRDPARRSGTLVFDGTRVPVEILLEYLEQEEGMKDFLTGHPTVFPERVRPVVQYWEDILSDAEGLEAARRRRLAHADWALISQRVARRIDAEAGAVREPPDLETLAAWAKAVARELGGESDEGGDDATADRPREGQPSHGDDAERLADAVHTLSDAVSVLRTAGEERLITLSVLARHIDALVDRLPSDVAARAVNERFDADAGDRVTDALHALTDAATALRSAAGALQGRHPVHAVHVRRLAEDIDELVTELRRLTPP